MAEMKKYLDTTALGTLVDQIKAEDAKVLKGAKEYADGLATNYDAAGSAAGVQGKLDEEIIRAKAAEEANTGLINAIKDGANLDSFADVEAEIAKYQLAGDYSVNGHKHTKADITDFAHNHEMSEINGLGDEFAKYQLAGNYSVEGHKHEIADVNGLSDALAGKEVAGEAAKVQGNLETYIESNNAAVALKADKTEVQALDGKVGTVAEGSTVVGMIEAVDGKADKNAGDIVTINETIKNIQENAYDDTALRGLISDNAEAIEALEGTHATDKAELEGKIKSNTDAIALLTNGVDPETVDGVNDLIAYVAEHGTEVTGMKADIKTNADDIDALEGRMDSAEAALGTVDSRIATAVSTKVENSVVEALDGRVEVVEGKLANIEEGAEVNVIEVVKVNGEALTVTDKAVDITVPTGALAGKDKVAEGDLETALATKLNGKADTTALNAAVEALEGVDAGQEARIAALEGKFDGEGSVSSLIEAAKTEAINTAAGDATTKANTAEGNAKTYADGLNTAMNSRVEALEAIDHDHANKAELDLIASGDKAKWDAAAAKAHEHTNKTVLDGITAEKVAAWDTVSEKASQEDLDDAMELIEANTSAINSFTPITSEEVNALFA